MNHGIPSANPGNLFKVNAIGARNADSNASWQYLCDRIFLERGWLVANFHGIDDGRIDREALGWEAMPLARFNLVLDYLESQDFWLAPFGEVARYIRERKSATLTLKKQSDQSMTLVLEDGLDDRIYNKALSLRIRLSAGWQKVTAYQNRRLVDHNLKPDGCLHLNLLPDGSDITIVREFAYRLLRSR
ncbi:hypothetical protein ES703_118279 [subsurface metagenome]